MLTKDALRTEYSARIAALTPEYRRIADEAITAALLSSAFYQNAENIFCFVGVKNEIDTLQFIKKAASAGKRVYAPRTIGGGIMEARLVTSEDDLEVIETGLGLTEPKTSCPLIAPEEIDLVIAPCISVDPYGHRLGYGGGYYDRYLQRIKKDAVVIALCRDETLAMTLPAGEHDIPTQYYATESGIKPTLSESFF